MFSDQIAAMQVQLIAMQKLADKTVNLRQDLEEAVETAKELGLLERFQAEIAVVVFPDKPLKDLAEQPQAANILSSDRLSRRKMTQIKKVFKSFFYCETEVITPRKVRNYFVDRTFTNSDVEVEQLMKDLEIQFQRGKDTRDYSDFWQTSKKLLEVLKVLEG